MQICKTKREIWILVILAVLYTLVLQNCGYGIYHRVQKGETLDRISKKYNVPEKEIINANRKGIFPFHPEKIKEGDFIYIPLDKADHTKAQHPEIEKTSENITDSNNQKNKIAEGNNQSADRTKIASNEKMGEGKSNLKKSENNKSNLAEVLGTKPNSQKTNAKNVQPKIKDDGNLPVSLAKANLTNEKKIKPKTDNIGLRFSKPIEGKIISEFGPRNGKMHKGIDIEAPEGESIKAAEDGVIIFSGFLKGYGNVVIIKHEGDLFTVYAHNRVNLVKEGEFVKKGQVIGKVGMTGNAETPHLHFEVRKKTKPLNPADFISN